jgi:hypothetical protein
MRAGGRAARFATWILAWILLAAGIAFVAVAICFSVRFYSIAPYADTWDLIAEVVRNHGRGTPAMLWAQHNEHRMGMTKLLLWADLFWFRGKQYSLIVETFIAQAVTAFLMIFTVTRLGSWKRAEALAALGVALFCQFYISQYEIFVWVFVQVSATYALATLAYVALARFSATQRRRWLAVAMGAALLAPLNLAGGLIVWPVLCFEAWVLRLRSRVLVLLCACAAVSIKTYLYHYGSPSRFSPWLSLRRPWDLGHYVLLYFASVWDAVARPLGYAFAACAIAAVIGWNLWIAIRRDATPLRVALLSLAGTLVVTGFVTATGRVTLGLEGATASRYQTSVLLFWSCIFILSMDVLLQYAPKLAPLLMAAALSTMVFAALQIPSWWKKGKEFDEGVAWYSQPILADVNDSFVPIISGDPKHIFELWGFMRVHGWSLFDTPEYRRLGTRMRDTYELSAANRCLGNLDGFEVVPDPSWPGYRVMGWGWDRFAGRALDRIIITGDTGKIIGSAAGSFVRGDVKNAVPEVTLAFTGWRGYVSGSLEWKNARAYGELPGGEEVCAFGGELARP